MPAADAVGVENDVAMLGRPADDDPIRLQLDDLPGRLAVGAFQKCHAGRLPAPPCGDRALPFSLRRCCKTMETTADTLVLLNAS